MVNEYEEDINVPVELGSTDREPYGNEVVKMGIRTIGKGRFMDYLKVQQSGKRNMFGYDPLIQKDGVYEKCYKHFVEDKKEESCEVFVDEK